MRVVREVPVSWLKDLCGLPSTKVADEGTILSAELAVGKALAKEGAEATHELGLLLDDLQRMAPKTKEVKARQDSLVRFIRTKLQQSALKY